MLQCPHILWLSLSSYSGQLHGKTDFRRTSYSWWLSAQHYWCEKPRTGWINSCQNNMVLGKHMRQHTMLVVGWYSDPVGSVKICTWLCCALYFVALSVLINFQWDIYQYCIGQSMFNKIYDTWRHNDVYVFVLLLERFRLQVSVIFFITTKNLCFPLLNSNISKMTFTIPSLPIVAQ